jgi:hypothetical protein
MLSKGKKKNKKKELCIPMPYWYFLMPSIEINQQRTNLVL